MGKHLFPQLAAQAIIANRRFYFPYLLTIIGTVAGFYNICAMATDPGMRQLRGTEYVTMFSSVGMVITAFFALIFIFYTNSFLMKRRKRELALYNILGMGKRHLALILLWESFFTALIGLGMGLLTGILFQKLVTLTLFRLVRLDVPFGFTISLPGILFSLLLFLAILLLTLLYNLGKITVTNPIALLHSTSAGEREPKTRWLLAILGVLTLGGGYTLAMISQNSQEALIVYFLAVILVIIGTYCLFTAVSIVILKLLRKNKTYYYKTSHFIGVSGMLYRMKQNAVGLANICILSTMVLVMLSGTLSLYIGMEDVTNRQAPTDLVCTLGYHKSGDMLDVADPDVDAMAASFRRQIEAMGQEVTLLEGNHYITFDGDGRNGRYDITSDASMRYGSLTVFTFLTAQDYAALTGQPVPELAEDQVLVHGISDKELVFTDGDTPVISLTVKETLSDFPAISGGGIGSVGRPAAVVVKDLDTLKQIRYLHGETANVLRSLRYEFRINLTGTPEEKDEIGIQLDNGLTFETLWQYFPDLADGSDDDFSASFGLTSRERVYADNFGLAGGFLFLGIFLGILFVMATVLIIYYKQISEGYEDQQRFQIMEKVGLTQRDIRRSINSQVLTVFFLPLGVAAVHILFDFRLMLQLLQIFSVTNVWLTALCSLGTLLVFTLLYGAVFLLTAKVYYRIVSR